MKKPPKSEAAIRGRNDEKHLRAVMESLLTKAAKRNNWHGWRFDCTHLPRPKLVYHEIVVYVSPEEGQQVHLYSTRHTDFIEALRETVAFLEHLPTGSPHRPHKVPTKEKAP